MLTLLLVLTGLFLSVFGGIVLWKSFTETSEWCGFDVFMAFLGGHAFLLGILQLAASVLINLKWGQS